MKYEEVHEVNKVRGETAGTQQLGCRRRPLVCIQFANIYIYILC